MTARECPLDGERLFVAHWDYERAFAPARPTRPIMNEDAMAAIASRHHRIAPAPRRLLPFLPSLRSLPAVHRPPSVADRRRWAVLAFAGLAAFALLLGAGSLAGTGQDAADGTRPGTGSGFRPIAATVHVVQPGDTLWSVARQVQPEGDVRPLVARLRAQHGTGLLLPGDRLRLAV